MAGTTPSTPLDLLHAIEQRARQNAAGLPQQTEVRTTWAGIGFRLSGQHYLAPMKEVTEILTPPQLTWVPGARPWVLGVANVRGTLLPIMDLQGFLAGRPEPGGRRERILVVAHKGITVGLRVDEVLGLRHFFEESFRNEVPQESANAAGPYLRGSYRQAEREWAVFSLHTLVQDPGFMQVAA